MHAAFDPDEAVRAPVPASTSPFHIASCATTSSCKSSTSTVRVCTGYPARVLASLDDFRDRLQLAWPRKLMNISGRPEVLPPREAVVCFERQATSVHPPYPIVISSAEATTTIAAMSANASGANAQRPA